MLFIKLMAVVTTIIFPIIYKLFGEKGIKAWQLILYQIGIERANILKDALGVDVNDARSLGRILDYDDSLAGVKGIWVEEKRGKATKVVRVCPIGRLLRPEICTNIIAAMEAGTFYPLNPRIKVPEVTKLISKGDDCCIGTIELPYLDKEVADKTSPYSTGKRYPTIAVPGLKKRLFLQSIRGFIKAILNFFRYGIRQEMYWYDFFKYKP